MFSFSPYFLYLLRSLSLVIASELPGVEKPYEVPVYNDLAYQRYNINVAVGTPPHSYSLLLDTGSSDVWFPRPDSSGCAPNCPTGFDPSESSSIVNTTIPYDARYGFTPDLAILGWYLNDTISISGLPPISDAQFAIGNVPPTLFAQGMWGIFGMGSRLKEAINLGPTSPFRGNRNATYTPLWERLVLASTSRKRKFSVWLNAQSAKTGSVQFGGEDERKYHGRLGKVPLNLKNGDFVDWSVNLTSVTRVHMNADGKENRTRLTAANYSLDYVLDTGSPNMYVPTPLYEAVVAGLNATRIINGAPYVRCSLRSSSTGYLDFGFGDTKNQKRSNADSVKIRVPYSEVIYTFGYPVTVPPLRDTDGAEMCYLGVVPQDGPIRLLGATFSRSAYLVFDADSFEVKMAQARWNTAI